MAVSVYLPKLTRGLVLAFDAHFLYDFSIKVFLTPAIDKVQCYIFFVSQNIKQNVLLSSYLDDC